jgi:NADH-quinone oxidoreductase subunit A
MQYAALPVFLFVVCAIGLAAGLLVIAGILSPGRPGRVAEMPYESGMDPIHDTRRRFDVRFHLLAIAFLVFDVELLFLFPWAVAMRGERRGERGEFSVQQSTFSVHHSLTPHPSPLTPVEGIDAAVAGGLVESRDLVFAGGMTFLGLLVLGFVYDWRKGIFQWR